MSSTIDLTVQIPSLPESWQGSVDDLLEFIQDNSIYLLDGQAPSIQIGGSRPTQNVGIYFTPTSVEYFQNGKYSPITDVPIGSMFPFAGVNAATPVNYLLCDGTSYLQSDYPDLFAIIGLAYGPTGSTTNFNVPNMAGRMPVGAGTGDYALNTSPPTGTGNMSSISAGVYGGAEWPRVRGKAPGSPSTAQSFATNILINGNSRYVDTVPPFLGVNYIIRAK